MEPKVRVVVVEDDPLLRDDLAAILYRGGHTVVASCADTAQMVAAVRDHAPDLVVFDVHLPGGDGIDAFRELSRDYDCAGIAVTGDAAAHTSERAVASDVLGFILKPVSAAQLLADVRLVTAQARRRAQDRREIEQYAAAVDDPTGRIALAKAKLDGPPLYLNDAGKHKFLIKHAHELGVSLVRMAELIVDNKCSMGNYCNLKKDESPGPRPDQRPDYRPPVLPDGQKT